MTTVIVVRPRFWLILGSNTESTNASPFDELLFFLYIYIIIFLKCHSGTVFHVHVSTINSILNRLNLQFMKNLFVFNQVFFYTL